MMGFEIKKSDEAFGFPKRKAEKNKDYLSFLHRLPCCISGVREVEAAHLSTANPEYGHYGRGKGSKAPDRWALPVSAELHRRQHSGNEMQFWDEVGIDPHKLALVLWGLFSEMGDDAEPFAIAVINRQLAERGRLRERDEF